MITWTSFFVCLPSNEIISAFISVLCLHKSLNFNFKRHLIIDLRVVSTRFRWLAVKAVVIVVLLLVIEARYCPSNVESSSRGVEILSNLIVWQRWRFAIGLTMNKVAAICPFLRHRRQITVPLLEHTSDIIMLFIYRKEHRLLLLSLS